MTQPPVRQIAVHTAKLDWATAGNSGPQARAPFEVDLGESLRGLWRRRWTVVTFLILGLAIGLLAAFAYQPGYTSETRLMLQERRNEILDDNVLSGITLKDETVETEIEVLASRDIRHRIAKAINLPAALTQRNREAENGSPVFQLRAKLSDWLAHRRDALGQFLTPEQVGFVTQRPETSEPVDFNGSIRFLSEAMEPRQAGNTSVLVVKVSDQDPQLAADIANAAAQVYLERQLEWKRDETAGANEFLEERIADLETDLEGKRRQLQRLRNVTGEVGSGGTLLAQRRLLSNQRLLDARNERIKISTNLEQVNAIIRSGDPDAIAIMVATPLMQQLRADQSTARQELAELATQFGERHPKLIDAQSRIKEIAGDIEAEARRHVTALRTELRAAEREEALLLSDLETQSAEDEALDEDRNRAEALQSEITAKQALLDDYLTRVQDAGELQAVLRPDARVISEAVPNEFADFPNRKVILAGSLALFGFLGLIAALIRDGADRSIRSVATAEKTLNVPVLGVIPALKGQFRRWLPVEYIANHPSSAFSEALRGVFTAMGIRPHQDKGQVLLVTSALPGEGKSSTASALAHQIARAGLKAVLVECDLRKPTLARNLRTLAEPGLIQILQGEITISNGIYRDTHYGMDVIPAGGTSENSLFMFQSAAMTEVIAQLTKSHDLIIIDSPPVIALPDAQILAEHAHAVLYLCHWGRTPKDTSSAGTRMLVRQGGATVMAALSQVDMKRYAAYDETYGDPSIASYYTR